MVCLQETKWVEERAKEIQNTGNKLNYNGKDRHKNGMGLVVGKHLKVSIMTVIRKGAMIISVELLIGETAISAHLPQVGMDEHLPKLVWMSMRNNSFGTEWMRWYNEYIWEKRYLDAVISTDI